MTRQITDDSVSAFIEGRQFSRQNMQITVAGGWVTMLLHGNAIARRNEALLTTTEISNAGWFSVTTKERLNGLLRQLSPWGIHSEKGDWILSNRAHGESKNWDGKWLELSTLHQLDEQIRWEREQPIKRRVFVGQSTTHITASQRHASATLSRMAALFPCVEVSSLAGWGDAE